MLQTRVLFLGPDYVGKTTLLYLLKLKEKIVTIPTIGFNVESIEYKDKKLNIFDIGGQEKIIALWRHYFDKTKCIVFIVNVSDKTNFDYYVKTYNRLLNMLEEEGFKHIPVVIFGNKFKEEEEFSIEEIINKSNIALDVSPSVIKGNILKGEGISELLDYFYYNLEYEEIKEEIKSNEEAALESNKEKDLESKEQKESLKVGMFGLDSSGKTSILYMLHLGEKVLTLPTIGYNVEAVDKKEWEKSLSIWDIGGNKNVRKLWVNYFNDLKGLIWVYDISDKERLEESQSELIKILGHPAVCNVPLLIYANKSDLNKSGNKVNLFLEGVKQHLGNRAYFIQESKIYDNESYLEGLNWLYLNMN